MIVTNPQARQVLFDQYSPEDFPLVNETLMPQEYMAMLHNEISPDSLKSYVIQLSQFETRNTGSDTISGTRGIGAARRWIHRKFTEFADASGNRLIPSYFQFERLTCDVLQHRNVVAVLPGLNPDGRELILIEGHMDSRCSTSCDTDCLAEGVEDNASGTALVMELARIFSQMALNETIVFMATTGEEQGLVGADAFATYVEQNDLALKAVLNNDVIGGIYCGETSSAPSCPGLDHVDSTQVRLFSQGGFDSPHKALSRFIKLQYMEEVFPVTPVPMQLTIMSSEDRAGRGSDHIPFRERGYPAMRFTSANEHGDASNGPDYHDRQHTSDDILGVDTDGDLLIDSFFVDFNYLARNCIINGTAAIALAMGPKPTRIDESYNSGEQFYIKIDDEPGDYLIGLRVGNNDFDTLYYLNNSNEAFFETRKKELFVFLSVARIDSNGIESMFSEEVLEQLTGIDGIAPPKQKPIRLLQNRPNPFDESTIISFYADLIPDYKRAEIVIRNLDGQLLKRIPVQIDEGVNELVYHHGYGTAGTMVYSLEINGRVIDSKRMVFAY